MKKSIFAFLIILITATANANVLIRNKNTDPNYALHVTYRLCHYVGSQFKCGDPQQVIIAKASDYTVANSAVFIDEASLLNTQDNSSKAQSTYLQYTEPGLGVTYSSCYASDDYENVDLPNGKQLTIDTILTLNDRGSPYIVCQSKGYMNK